MMIKTFLLGATLIVAAPAAASYTPVGPQTNVALATVTGGGWSLCYSELMSTPFGNSAATTLAACSGSNLMLAGRETGSSTLLVLAQTTMLDALTPTGQADNNVFTTSNGADWFYNDRWSWGFKRVGDAYSKFECGSGTDSMCVHTYDFVGGFSIGNIAGLNNSPDYEKLVFTNNAVPEPSAWAMLIAGFGLVGAMQRRSRSVLAA